MQDNELSVTPGAVVAIAETCGERKEGTGWREGNAPTHPDGRSANRKQGRTARATQTD